MILKLILPIIRERIAAGNPISVCTDFYNEPKDVFGEF